MNMSGQQNNMPSQTEMGQIGGITVGRSVIQRPVKSAAYKYRHIIQSGHAIAEEIDYPSINDQNVMIGGYFQRGGHNLMIGDDVDSFQDGARPPLHPSGMQIHRNERKSAVRLKHNDGYTTGSTQLNKTTQHTVSHGAGVLLGNLQYGVENELIREFNNSNTSGTLKSVYDMRVSHSRESSGPASKGKNNMNKSKRKHVQSAITRSTKPTNLTMAEVTSGSHQNILNHPVNILGLRANQIQNL